MIHFAKYASPLRRQATALSVLIAGFSFVSVASALDLDFNVANGNFTTVGNWVNTTNALPDTVATPIPLPAAAVPTVDPPGPGNTGDNAYVRNGGTITINSNVAAKEIRIGQSYEITNPDYDGSTVVDAGDYVLWRKGVGPLLYDPTPESVGPDDYTLWRYRFGGTPAVDQNIGGSGALNWTAGEISGVETPHPVVANVFSGGPILRLGRHVAMSATTPEYEFTGTVTQNGATTKIMLTHPESKLNIGDEGDTASPTSSYTLINGTIGTAVTASGLAGGNGNNGILVRNGTFTMLGGNIVDATPAALGAPQDPQRFITVSSATGTVGNEAVATATFTGGNVNSLGGLRVGVGANTKGYLNINGPVTIITGGDTILGHHKTSPDASAIGDSYAEMNMSAGTLQVGRTTDTNGNTLPTSFAGRFQVGNRSKGVLNMSGGSITIAASDIRVAGEFQAGGSAINMTGGTITTPGLSIRRGARQSEQFFADEGASIILDGPNAVFTQAGASGTIIGEHGKGLFEVRQGTATLGQGVSTTVTPIGNVNVGRFSDSQATLNLKGGKLIIAGTLDFSINDPVTAPPVIGLTGGTLELNNPYSAAAMSWRPNFTNTGSKLVLTQNALRQVTVGGVSPEYLSNFSMTSGSWDIELGLNTVLGADWFNVANGTASLTGGTLNLSFLSGFTPNVGQVYRILRGAKGTTLGSIAINAPASPGFHWELLEAPITNINFPLDEEIQLKYVAGASASWLGGSTVPEPSSAVLVVFAAMGLLSARRPRSRTRA